MNENEIIYREFWVKATLDQMRRLQDYLRSDDNTVDFDRIMENIGSFDNFVNDPEELRDCMKWVKDFIRDHADRDDQMADWKVKKIGMFIDKLNIIIDK